VFSAEGVATEKEEVAVRTRSMSPKRSTNSKPLTKKVPLERGSGAPFAVESVPAVSTDPEILLDALGRKAERAWASVKIVSNRSAGR
jgi:hypothetical protein